MSQEFKSFSSSAATPATVDGVDLEFLPCRMETLLRFQPVITSAWKALDVLLKDSEKDKGQEQETVSGPDGASVVKFNVVPPSVEVVKLRFGQRSNAIEQISNAMTSPEAIKALGSMILDSLRGCDGARKAFVAADIDTKDPAKFFTSLTPSMTVGLISGMWQANKGAFGPLAEKAVQAAASAAGRVQERVANLNVTQTPDPTSTDSSGNSKTT